VWLIRLQQIQFEGKGDAGVHGESNHSERELQKPTTMSLVDLHRSVGPWQSEGITNAAHPSPFFRCPSGQSDPGMAAHHRIRTERATKSEPARKRLAGSVRGESPRTSDWRRERTRDLNIFAFGRGAEANICLSKRDEIENIVRRVLPFHRPTAGSLSTRPSVWRPRPPASKETKATASEHVIRTRQATRPQIVALPWPKPTQSVARPYL
jgi:hypothetical protein